MAKKIVIVGDAMVLDSTLTLDQIKMLEKYDPKALMVYEADEDGHKQTVFRVASTTGKGCISEYGICFANETRNEEKNATITLQIPGNVTDVMQYAEDLAGAAIAHLATVEAQAVPALEAVAAKRAALRGSIQVI